MITLQLSLAQATALLATVTAHRIAACDARDRVASVGGPEAWAVHGGLRAAVEELSAIRTALLDAIEGDGTIEVSVTHNREGLTWPEWALAAGPAGTREAWREGVDPTEFRTCYECGDRPHSRACSRSPR